MWIIFVCTSGASSENLLQMQAMHCPPISYFLSLSLFFVFWVFCFVLFCFVSFWVHSADLIACHPITSPRQSSEVGYKTVPCWTWQVLNRDLKGYMYPNVHNSIINNIQTM